MKTAMQELYDNLNAMRIDGKLQLSPIAEEILANEFNNLLEKEKEQIRMAFTDGRWDGKFRNMTSEEYYNQNYNQNK